MHHDRPYGSQGPGDQHEGLRGPGRQQHPLDRQPVPGRHRRAGAPPVGVGGEIPEGGGDPLLEPVRGSARPYVDRQVHQRGARVDHLGVPVVAQVVRVRRGDGAGRRHRPPLGHEEFAAAREGRGLRDRGGPGGGARRLRGVRHGDGGQLGGGVAHHGYAETFRRTRDAGLPRLRLHRGQRRHRPHGQPGPPQRLFDQGADLRDGNPRASADPDHHLRRVLAHRGPSFRSHRRRHRHWNTTGRSAVNPPTPATRARTCARGEESVFRGAWP